MSTTSLQGSKVVIIGGSAGIGLSTARRCLSHGAQVTIGGRTQDKLDAAAEQLEGDTTTVVVDIDEESTIEALFERQDRVDHVFVNAGSAKGGSILGSELSVLEASIQDRIWGPIHVARYAVSKMHDNSSLTIMSGLWGSVPNDITSVGLAGREMLTRILAKEMAPIRVNAIAPGPIQTGIFPQAAIDKYAPMMLVKRLGTPEDVAEAVILLMTNGFITGAVLHIDGGARFLYSIP